MARNRETCEHAGDDWLAALAVVVVVVALYGSTGSRESSETCPDSEVGSSGAQFVRGELGEREIVK